MNGLQIFSYEDRQVRTTEMDGEAWFVGKDVAEVLGYENPSKAVRVHVDEEDKKVGVQNGPLSVEDSMGRIQYPTWINESGLYSLILSSKLPSAKKFKRWVTSEVLPALRKTGSYSMVDSSYTLKDEAESLEVAARMLNTNDASKILMLKKFYKERGVLCGFLPKYEDNGGRQLFSATELLKRFDLGMTVVKFNQLLVKEGYLEERERSSSKGGTKKFKALTGKAKPYGENQIAPQNPKEVQPLYYEDTFRELFDKVTGKK